VSGVNRGLRACCIVAFAAAMAAATAQASVRSEAFYARGLIAFDGGQWQQAYGLFDQAVRADSKDALALYYRGLTQARRGAPSAAIQDIEAALKLDPTLPHAALDLGIAYFDGSQYEQAKAWLERAHQQSSERFTAAFFLGLTLYRLGDDVGAQTYLNEAKADPELRASAQYYTGLAMLRQGKTEAGRAELAQVAGAQPQSEVGAAAQRAVGAEVRQPPRAQEAERKKPWSLYGELGFEYDSNVVIAPSDSDVKTAEGISGESDGRTVIEAGGAYTLLDTEYGSLRAAYDFYQSIHFQLTDFDLQGHRVRLDAVSRPGFISYGLSGTYDFYALDYRSFFQEGLGTPWVAVAEGDGGATQLYYTVRGRDFFREPFNPSRDAIDHAVGVRQYLVLGSPERVLSAGYQFDAEDTLTHGPNGGPIVCTPTTQTSGCGGRDFQYKAHQLDLGVSLPFPNIVRVQLAYLFRLEDYQFPNSRLNFGSRRHDAEHQFVVALTHDLTSAIAVGLDYFGVVNGSNVPDFDYDRNIVSANVRVTY
jgi:tetratricopeptide (TPR) repeat protein